VDRRPGSSGCGSPSSGGTARRVSLYEKIGFETSNTESFELEMALRLNEPSGDAAAEDATDDDSTV